VEVAVGVGRGAIGKAEPIGDELPVLAIDEQAMEGEIAAEVLGVHGGGEGEEREKAHGGCGE
jgi:hypothetical protein